MAFKKTKKICKVCNKKFMAAPAQQACGYVNTKDSCASKLKESKMPTKRRVWYENYREVLSSGYF
jgi:hypothetical protein